MGKGLIPVHIGGQRVNTSTYIGVDKGLTPVGKGLVPLHIGGQRVNTSAHWWAKVNMNAHWWGKG